MLEKCQKNETPAMAKKWKMAGFKVRSGLGFMHRRDLSNIDTFIVRESEVKEEIFCIRICLFILFQVACLEDQLELEGKCLRKSKDKRSFRKTGCVTIDGRGDAW